MKVNENDIIKIIEEADVLTEEVDTLIKDIPLVEQGIDSLDIVNIYLLIEEKLEVKIPDEDLDKVKSIKQIIEYINNK